jgi:hypothetical protein
MQKYQFVSSDTILAKYHRDFRGLDILESDAIEWIGEALGFAKMPGVLKENVAFVEVKNHRATLPVGYQYIIQIARDNDWTPETKEECTLPAIAEALQQDCDLPECRNNCDFGLLKNAVPVDCQGNIIGDYEVAYYRPFFNLQFEYNMWNNSKLKHSRYTAVKLSNHSFFKSLVCQEVDSTIYNRSTDEYTIEHNSLIFSFKEGFVAIAYLGNMLDPETGYPMIPDDEPAKAAITYYIGWKVKERECWNHREGSCQLAEKAEAKWLKYIKQFKNNTKMFHIVDELVNFKNENQYFIPRIDREQTFFGNMGDRENKAFLDPSFRNPNRRTK